MRITAKDLTDILQECFDSNYKLEIHEENGGCSIWISDEVVAYHLLKKSK